MNFKISILTSCKYSPKEKYKCNYENSRINIQVILVLCFLFLVPGLNINKQNHILNGNIMKNKHGYNYFYWNCARGLISKEKIEDIRLLADSQNIHIIGISEVDLSKENYSREEIDDIYQIKGYSIVLPRSWESHGKARVIVYIKEDLKVKVVEGDASDDDIQHVLLDVGFGQGRHYVSMYYRE